MTKWTITRGETHEANCNFCDTVFHLFSGAICLGSRAAPKPPELKVLEKFVGTWDCEIVTKPALWTPKESRMKAVEVNEMALDGWFLHGCSKTPDRKTLQF